MRTSIRLSATFLLAITVAMGGALQAQNFQDRSIANALPDEPYYMGRPLSYWINVLRTRDENKMEIAFEAIRNFGPAAAAAVPELTRIIKEPYSAIRIGLDSHDIILSKLLNIQLRGDAVDALGMIGNLAATATEPLIDWALTIRIIPENLKEPVNRELFVDLVAVDVIQRMRVAGAIAQFGSDALPDVAIAVTSPDDERRKLAVAILNEQALPVAAGLLKSPTCEDQQLGISILIDMWPVVAANHLIQLRNARVCLSTR